jgi:hypothetical protein
MRRSARRSTLRATSSAAEAAVSPGTMNSRGISTVDSQCARSVSTAFSIASDTRVTESFRRETKVGLVASSAPTTKSSRW